jgi:acyl-coenzyme A thioesterase PaaI-like protein
VGPYVYTVLDTACYCAGAGMWAVDENAVTLDIHVQVLRPGGTHEVELRGRVLKRGRTMLFGQSEAWSDGKLIAVAAVTKSIVALPR